MLHILPPKHKHSTNKELFYKRYFLVLYVTSTTVYFTTAAVFPF